MYDQVQKTAEYIRTQWPEQAEFGVILGSGLGGLTERLTQTVEMKYADIPGFPRSASTVKGHGGRLVGGRLGTVPVLIMDGRFHYYEGYAMKEVTYPVFVMQALGIRRLIVTNACGGINTNMEPGDLMLITDFINLFGTNPLIGANDERFGPRFPDMSEPYAQELIAAASRIGNQLGIRLRGGVYAGVSGPYYETKAEIAAFGRMGADAVGMSTVPETIVANYLGMQVLGIGCITNMATGIQTERHSHDKVVATANRAARDLIALVSGVIEGTAGR